MDALTLIFLGILILLIISHFVCVEAFNDGTTSSPGSMTYKLAFDPISESAYDPSGVFFDASGNFIGPGSMASSDFSIDSTSGNTQFTSSNNSAYSTQGVSAAPNSYDNSYMSSAAAAAAAAAAASSAAAAAFAAEAQNPPRPYVINGQAQQTMNSSSILSNIMNIPSSFGASPTKIDSSGNVVPDTSYHMNLSVSDLIALIGNMDASGNSSKKNKDSKSSSLSYGLYAWAAPSQPMHDPHTGRIHSPALYQQQKQFDNQFYGSPLDDTLYVTNVISPKKLSGECVNLAPTASPAVTQGKVFMNYVNGINPADYIRKDSIPCYACTLPA